MYFFLFKIKIFQWVSWINATTYIYNFLNKSMWVRKLTLIVKERQLLPLSPDICLVHYNSKHPLAHFTSLNPLGLLYRWETGSEKWSPGSRIRSFHPLHNRWVPVEPGSWDNVLLLPLRLGATGQLSPQKAATRMLWGAPSEGTVPYVGSFTQSSPLSSLLPHRCIGDSWFKQLHFS